MAIAENTLFLYADVNELWHAVGRDFVILETIVDIVLVVYGFITPA